MSNIIKRIRRYHGKETVIWQYRYYDANGKRKEFSYSENQYSIYAKILIEQSVQEMKYIRTLIEIKEDYAIMKLYSKTYGFFEVLIDLDDVEKVRYVNWTLTKSINDKFYVRHNKLGRLHRYLMNEDNEEIEIDHINRNTLDCRKSNLRQVDKSTNQKNRKISKLNKSKITGVRYDNKTGYWWAQIQIDGKQINKSFSSKKYGYEEAKKKAVSWRKKQEKENGYIGE